MYVVQTVTFTTRLDIAFAFFTAKYNIIEHSLRRVATQNPKSRKVDLLQLVPGPSLIP